VRPCRSAGAIAADIAAVVLFATLGRNAHDERSGAAAVLTIAAPFLVGLAVGWIVNPAVRRQPLALRAGVGVWLTTVAIGLVLRRTVWDRGTAASFVIVSTLVLGALIVGWRAMWVFACRRRELPSASPPSKAGR
jgi:hypothetical protein